MDRVAVVQMQKLYTWCLKRHRLWKVYSGVVSTFYSIGWCYVYQECEKATYCCMDVWKVVIVLHEHNSEEWGSKTL